MNGTPALKPEPAEVWITGIGLATSLGEGLDANWDALNAGRINVDEKSFAPYVVHPWTQVNLDTQIPKKGDQRQMEAWQRIGTYAAGLALESAGVKGNKEILGRMDMVIAAGGGERDIRVDTTILNAQAKGNAAPGFLNERLMSDLRPTLFLAQLSNLLAGNIAIVHGVCGTSRTFMGEEVAGVDATRIALARIAAGQSDIALIGGSHNGERKDLIAPLRIRRLQSEGQIRAGLGASRTPRLCARLGRRLPRHRVQGARGRTRRKTVCTPDPRGLRPQPARQIRRDHRLAAEIMVRVSAVSEAMRPSSRARPVLNRRRRRSGPSSANMQTARCARPARVSVTRWIRSLPLGLGAGGAFALTRLRCFRPAIPPAWRLKCRSRRPRLWWLRPGTGGAKAWPWSRPSVEARSRPGARRARRCTGGENMTAPRDKFGRPIVVVTGMGVITSLGAGKTDNWAKLTAGESGIRTLTRFPIEGLKTTMAGTIDFIPVEPFSSVGLSERLAVLAIEEAIAQAGIGSKGDFPGPLFLAVPPVEIEWPQREELGRGFGTTDFSYDDLLAVCGGGKFETYHHRFQMGSVADYLAATFGTKGSPISLSTACASGATAIQLGVEAIRRGETDAACARAPRPRSTRKVWCAFRCCRRCRPRTFRRRLPRSHSRRTATALSWRRAQAPSCLKAMRRRSRGALRSSA